MFGVENLDYAALAKELQLKMGYTDEQVAAYTKPTIGYGEG